MMAILQEIKIESGEVDINGKVAYVSQEPWIFAGTVRQNILFGMNYDQKYFQKVVEACALETDFKILKNGDKTLIGEKGDTLSGGQKARICLARAVYRNADIYLLDDPLSAVDSKVGKHIFQRCIKTLLKNKVVILASHQTQYAKYATQVLYLEEDEAIFNDSGSDASRFNPSIFDNENEDKIRKKSRSLTFFFHNDIQRNHPDTPKPKRKTNRKITFSQLENSNSINSIYDERERTKTLLSVYEDFEKSDNKEKKVNRENDRHGKEKISDNFKSNARKKMSMIFTDQITEFDRDDLEIEDKEVEPSQRGAVPYSMYKKYFIEGVGYIKTVFVFLLIVFTQALLLFTDYWTGDWSNGESQRVDNETITATFYIEDDPDKNIYILIALVLTGSVLNLIRAVLFYATLLKCSRRLHNKMLNSILKAPIYFFTSNPIGQVLNRFSRDMLMMDEELPWMFYNFLQFGLMNLAIVVINCVNVPYLIIIVLPSIVAAFFGRRYFIKTAAEVKKLESSSQSPLFTHIASTLSGITTIRTYDKCPFVLKEFYNCMDYATEARITFILCSRWFSQRIDFLALIFSVCSIFAPVIAIKVSDDIDEGLVAVSLTYAMSLGGIFQWFVRQSAEVENLMTSVDRVYEYTRIELEKDYELQTPIKSIWPQYGKVQANHVTYSYHSSLEPVVKDMKFVIEAREKIGIVGRTGAGKSTLISLLLRLGNTSGEILVDSYNIDTLPLKFLRRNISVIPQNPVLFNSSLRNNLDPFQVFTDEEIWNSLEKVNMKESIAEHSAGLQLKISESGSNMSVGERQLLCLARAVLKNSKILLVDEATANVDNETDRLIQDTIRTVFVDCTVLTVAHRLNTIIDYDKIMVMDSGNLVEFDSPNNLLQNENGYFRRLVDEMDKREAIRLKKIALDRHIFSIGDDNTDDI